jgi:modulator of FtsH protease
MNGWETTVSTGNPAYDQQMVEHYRAQAAQSGMQLQVNPLPSGGYHVRAVPAQQQAFAQAAPPQQQQYAYAAPHSSPAAAPAAGPAAAAQPLTSERLAYLRKVYGLLGSAALIAILAGWALLELTPTAKFKYAGKTVVAPILVAEMWNNPILMYGAFGALFVGTLIASWTSKVPVVNVIMLYLVSLLMGVELAPMVMIAQLQAGLGGTISTAPVRDAFLMVGAIFAGITAYVFISKKDFSYLGAIVSMGVLVVMVGCILTFVLGSEIFTLAICSVGALVAALFLVWQTWWVLKGDMDDPVGDALVFLVQLRNLFMFLLRIFMSRD